MTHKVPIDKGIPMDVADLRRRANRYPWRDMEIGDSFLFSDDAYPELAYALTRQANKYNQPKKFVMKKVLEGGIEHFRCWRVL